MAAYVAGDVTVVVTETLRVGKEKKNRGTMAIANGPTYPTAGISLPPITSFGFSSYIKDLVITGNNARTVSYLWQYNKTAHKLLAYEEEATAAGGPLLECDTSEAPAAVTLDWIAWGY